jgi:hypothetical protein
LRCTIGSFIVAEAMVALCRRRRRWGDGDGDRILDREEGVADADHDGTPNYQEPSPVTA